jgi:hypothetical protein
VIARTTAAIQFFPQNLFTIRPFAPTTASLIPDYWTNNKRGHAAGFLLVVATNQSDVGDETAIAHCAGAVRVELKRGRTEVSAADIEGEILDIIVKPVRRTTLRRFIMGHSRQVPACPGVQSNPFDAMDNRFTTR